MEESEFEHIAAGIRNKVIGTSRNLGLAPSDAEDVAQEVMLKLWSMHSTLEQYRSLDALAVVIAKRLILSERRKSSASSLEEIHRSIVDEGMMPNEQLEEKETESWILKKIVALPSTQHTILYMRQVEERSNEEIARILGIEKDSVCALLSKARKTLLDDIRKRMAAETKRRYRIK